MGGTDETEAHGMHAAHFLGEILSYEDSNDGLVAIVNDLYSSGEKSIIGTEKNG